MGTAIAERMPPSSTRFDCSRMTLSVSFCRRQIGHLSSPLASHYSVKQSAGRRLKGDTSARLQKFRHIMARHKAKASVIVQIKAAKLGITDANGLLHHRLEHGLQIAWRKLIT
jgi:hypothetical protein